METIIQFFYKRFFGIIRLYSFGVFLFLVLPILVIIPLSFSSGSYFTFTKEMLSLDPEAYSLRWYRDFINDEVWILAMKNSFYLAISSSFLAVTLGTVAAIGMSSPKMPFRNLIMAFLISPMIVPLIIMAVGFFFFFANIGLLGSDLSLIIAHAILGVPFVLINVTAALSAYDSNLTKASFSLGAGKVQTFFKVILPIVRPGVISGGLFAFITSFDEVVIVIFLASPEQKTIPRQMFSGLREQISPTILAVSCFLLIISLTVLITLQIIERRKIRIRES